MSPEWATDALDEVRRQVWNTARQQGDTALARQFKGARFALWNNPEDLTGRQRGKLDGAAGGVAGLGQALPHRSVGFTGL